MLVGMGTEESEPVPDMPVAEVPDVVSFDAIDACALVRQAGLVPRGPDGTDAPTSGVVLAQTPEAAHGATVGDGVVLQVDSGNLAPD